MNRYEIAQQAKLQLASLSASQRTQALTKFAELLASRMADLFRANARDLDEQKDKISSSLYQRLKFDESKFQPVWEGVRHLAKVPDPVGVLEWSRELDRGLVLEQRRSALGVVGVIFESRPDVLPQILSLMLRTGNAVIFKGGAEARHSQEAMMEVVKELNLACGFLPSGWAQLLETRQDVKEMLSQTNSIDLIIPRGSNDMVKFVMSNTEIPVLGHAEGICHIYVHKSSDVAAAIPIICDAKVQYPSACNALETLLVDEAMWPRIAPRLLRLSVDQKIQMVASEDAFATLTGLAKNEGSQVLITRATENSWRTEYSDLILNVRVVKDVASAITHINTYGSHHTDCILHNSQEIETQFFAGVDSANVYANCSTRFSDGFRYGFGAEVGISTGKLPPRGPVGIDGLLTYKYFLRGTGQVVSDYVGESARKFTHRDLK